MPNFSRLSEDRLLTCDERLVLLFREVIKKMDCTVLCGHRGETEQNRAFEDGFSDVRWPDGKHNKFPSMAADVAPYPYNPKNKEAFYYFAGYVQGVADRIGVRIRWGGDWDMDNDLMDNKLYDLAHFELVA